MAKTYDVMLVNKGEHLFRVIKAIKESCKLDITEAKDKVDSCWLLDTKLKTVDSYDEAQRIKAVVEEAGATVRIDTNGAEEQEDDIWNSVSVMPSKRNNTKSSTNAPHGYTVFLENEGDDRDAMIEALMKLCGFSRLLAEEKTGFRLLLSNEPLKVKLSLEDAEELVRKLERASSDAKLIIKPSEADEEDPEDYGKVAPYGYTVFLKDEGDDRESLIEALMKHCGFSKSLAEDKTGYLLLLGKEPLKVKLSLEDAEELVRKLERASSDAKLIINPSEADEEDPEDDGDDEDADDSDTADETPNIDWDMIHGGTKYYCVLGGQSFGPVNIHQLTNMVTFGIVTGETLMWTDGMSDWIPARSMPKVCNLVP